MSSSLPRRRFLFATGAAAGSAVLSAEDQSPAATIPRSAPPESAPLEFRDRVAVRMNVNGNSMAAEVQPRTTLLDWLREYTALSGTKKGCNEGACGACTVLVGGKRVNACLTLVAGCDGLEVTTVEGLTRADGTLHPVQAAFVLHDAFQCGYCTSGQVVSAVGCIREGRTKDAETVREWMSGNLCRCAAYPQITAAVLDAAKAG